MQYLSDIPPYPSISQFTVTFPTTRAAIVARFQEHLCALPRIKGKKIVAIIDSFVSTPGVLMPWQDMVKACKEEHVWSVIDAAHSIGQEPDINLSEAQPDFWVSVRLFALNQRTEKTNTFIRTVINGFSLCVLVRCCMFLSGRCLFATDDMQAISANRNQHIILSSIPTAHTYISPADRVEPNFVPQFECQMFGLRKNCIS